MITRDLTEKNTDEVNNNHTSVRVKDLDIDDQPREKAAKYGIGALSIADLLALILRTGIKGKSITELCRDIMRDNDGSLHNLERRSSKALRAIKGLGETKVLQIEAVMEIVRRYMKEAPGENFKISSAKDTFNLMRGRIANLPHEEIWIIMMSNSHEVTRVAKVSQGGTAATVFDIKLILKEALLEDTSAIILCHNHPSGNLKPSAQDDNITRICMNGCHAVGISMLDHVIITATEHYSYFEEGRLPQPTYR